MYQDFDKTLANPLYYFFEYYLEKLNKEKLSDDLLIDVKNTNKKKDGEGSFYYLAPLLTNTLSNIKFNFDIEYKIESASHFSFYEKSTKELKIDSRHLKLILIEILKDSNREREPYKLTLYYYFDLQGNIIATRQVKDDVMQLSVQKKEIVKQYIENCFTNSVLWINQKLDEKLAELTREEEQSNLILEQGSLACEVFLDPKIKLKQKILDDYKNSLDAYKALIVKLACLTKENRYFKLVELLNKSNYVKDLLRRRDKLQQNQIIQQPLNLGESERDISGTNLQKPGLKDIKSLNDLDTYYLSNDGSLNEKDKKILSVVANFLLGREITSDTINPEAKIKIIKKLRSKGVETKLSPSIFNQLVKLDYLNVATELVKGTNSPKDFAEKLELHKLLDGLIDEIEVLDPRLLAKYDENIRAIVNTFTSEIKATNTKRTLTEKIKLIQQCAELFKLAIPSEFYFELIEDKTNKDSCEILKCLFENIPENFDGIFSEKEKNTLLIHAIKNSNETIVQYLLGKTQVNPNRFHLKLGKTPLSIALEQKQIKIAGLLVQKGANPFLPDHVSHLMMVKELFPSNLFETKIEDSFKLPIYSMLDYSPQKLKQFLRLLPQESEFEFYFEEDRSKTLLQRLVCYKDDINKVLEQSKRQTHIVQLSNELQKVIVDVLTLLKKKVINFDIEQTDKNKRTLLALACFHTKNLHIIKWLIQNQADPNRKIPFVKEISLTPFQFAIGSAEDNTSIEIIKYLLEQTITPIDNFAITELENFIDQYRDSIIKMPKIMAVKFEQVLTQLKQTDWFNNKIAVKKKKKKNKKKIDTIK